MINSTERSSWKTRGSKKTYFNMAASNTDVFDCQAKACEKFFQEQLPKVQKMKLLAEDDIPKHAKLFKEPKIYDITSFDAQEVVQVLSCIVNDRDQFTTNKTFYLLLRNDHENKTDKTGELFRLNARPKKDQPGNTMVFLRPRGKERFTEPAKNYDQLNGALKAYYDKDTARFARDIRKLFKNNAEANNSFPQAMFEAYLFLLFEVARRLVELEEPSEKKKQFDVLPIGSAIARIVRLLESGICTFEDVFFSKSKFHCFTGKPKDRRKAIENINETIEAIDTAGVQPSTSAATLRFLEELKEMFCSEEPEAMPRKEEKPEAMLQKEFEALSMSIEDSKALSMKTKKSAVNTETFSVFDHA